MGRKRIYEDPREAGRVYRAKLAEIRARVPKNDHQRYTDAAAAAGMSLTAFVVSAMNEKIERDGLLPAPDPAGDGQPSDQE